MIYICYQNKFGGTDMLLRRMELWLRLNNYIVASDITQISKDVEIDLVVTPTSEMHRLCKLKKNGLKFKKILVWSMGHGALKAAFYNNSFEKILFGIPKYTMDFFVRKLALSLLKTNSLVFTDKVGLKHDLSGVFLPSENENELLSPIAIKNYESLTAKDDKKLKNVFGWVGRISKDFKLSPLIKLIEDIESVARERNEIFDLIIVGDGDGTADLTSFINNLRFVEVNWIKEIDNENIVEFIDTNIDILFAMGTSALDGANASTATVIVQPFSYTDKKPEKGYRWIFDSKGYSLGEFPGLRIEPPQVEVCITEIFNDIEKQGLRELSKKSRNYSTLFHEDNVFRKMFCEREISKVNRETFFYLLCLSMLNHIKYTTKRIVSKSIIPKRRLY